MSVKYLLDTNICIYIINKRPPEVFEHFQRCRAGEIGVSSITGAELAFGVAKSGSTRNRQALDKFLAPLEVLQFDVYAMYEYGAIRSKLEHSGRPIGAMDTLIAAHARALGVILVTNNEREFARVDQLQLANWVK